MPPQPNEDQLRTWFAAIDKDSNGHLSTVELQSALQLGGLNFSVSTVSHIIRIHDRDGTGTITFNEFRRLHEFLTNVQASFEYFDRDHSGSLSYEEIYSALAHAEFLGLTLFLKSATATFNAFDTQKTGVVNMNFNQFLYACANTM